MLEWSQSTEHRLDHKYQKLFFSEFQILKIQAQIQQEALRMQMVDPKLFNRANGKHDSGNMHRVPPNSDFSQASTYTDRSGNDQKRLQSTKSKRSFSFAKAFINCFAPQVSEIDEGVAQEGFIPANDYSSASTSNASTISSNSYSKFKCHQSPNTSSNSHSKFKYHHSPNTSNTWQERPKFSIQEIYKATGSFSMENKIGQGGFGTVYKGKLKDGTLVAVKRAKKTAYDSAEFKSEIQTLSKVEHQNLVRFLGCLEQNDEQIIVIEYVGNGTLREHLDGTCGVGLELAERLDIAIDVAHAVTYLHMYTDRPIIHRDIKPSNILLTEKLRAKVADFGFARFTPENPDATHISTGVKGTVGYLDPEYLQTYQLTEKSDVYSFGVLLVELVSGRRPIESHRTAKERVTTRWAVQRYKAGESVMAMDPKLRRRPASLMVVERVMGLAVQCLAPTRKARPSMKKCAEVLWGVRRDYQEMQRLSSPNSTPETVRQQRSSGP